MADYMVKTRIRTLSERFLPGDIINGLDRKEAERLVRNGAIELVIEEKKTVKPIEKPKNPPPADK